MDWSRALSDSRPGSRGAFDFGSREGEVADGGAIMNCKQVADYCIYTLKCMICIDDKI